MNSARNGDYMEKEILDYLLDYIFQRIEVPGQYSFDHTSLVLTLENIRVNLPSLKRKQPLKIAILNHSISFYRYKTNIVLEQLRQNHFELSFDLLGEVFDHLTLVRENDPNFDPSSMDVFLPALDMKIFHFFELLKPYLQIKYRNFQGKNFALCLTHDIDRTGDSWKYRVITHCFQALKQKRPSLIFRGLFGANREANFQSIIDIERSYDAKATWFYLTRYGLRKNADYHMSDKMAQKSLKLIQEAGHEVGLHIPFMEMAKEIILQEKRKIPTSTNFGVRIHYLRGEYSQVLPLFAECGFPFDSTFGFRRNMAYRFGSSVPFHPIIDHNITKIFEIPMNIMDIQVTSLKVFQEKIQMLFQILEKVHGVCVINWHNNRFNEVKFGSIWSKSFEILLEEGKKHNAWFTSLSNVINHFQNER